jgi:hypothetical protein
MKDPSSTPADTKLYQSIVGSLQHASIYTRPDITLTTCTLNRYLKEPTETHLKAAVKVVNVRLDIAVEMRHTEVEPVLCFIIREVTK